MDIIYGGKRNNVILATVLYLFFLRKSPRPLISFSFYMVCLLMGMTWGGGVPCRWYEPEGWKGNDC